MSTRAHRAAIANVLGRARVHNGSLAKILSRARVHLIDPAKY
jgi:hypothetical protein